MRLHVARWAITGAIVVALAPGWGMVGAGVPSDSLADGSQAQPRREGTSEHEIYTLAEFLFLLEPGRADLFETGPTDKERGRFTEHFEHLRRLLASGTLRFAGRCADGAPGIVVVRAKSLDEAKKLLHSDPAIAAGVMRGTVRPFRTALFEGIANPRLPAGTSDGVIRVKATVQASLEDVWRAWTTNEGARKWFADDTNIELRVGGPYEIYFGPIELAGRRGSEGCKVLSFLPSEMLSFDWNAPPKFGDLRERRTRVVVLFERVDRGRVQVRVAHLGFGKGERWDEVYVYFTNAWPRVMDNFRQHFSGPSGDQVEAKRRQPPIAESGK